MMQSPSKLNSTVTSPVFIDTSVLINLLAADCLDVMAIALNRPLCVSDYVARELTRDPRDNSDGAAAIARFTQMGVLQVVTLDEAQAARFVNFVGAVSPDDLGDGEAATLACGIPRGHVAIDERKARRVAARDWSDLTVYSTLDLLCSAQAFDYFGPQRVHECVQRALFIGRMRIPFEWREWIAGNLPNAEKRAPDSSPT